MKKISIVSPCYNEQDNVRECYETVRALFERELPGYQREHVFADNCSTDGTVAVLREIAASDPAVKIVVNARNFGVFRSTFNALRYASGDATLLMLPVDLQDPPELLPQFVKLWEQGHEVVAGQRSNREEGLVMRSMRGTFYRIVNRLAGFEIPEGVGEFQLVDRKVLDAVLRYDDHYPYIRGMVAACGFKRIVIPYVWKSRKRGASKIRIWELFDQAFNGMFSFTNVPMRLATLFGFVLAGLCLLYAIITLAAFVVAPSMAPRGIVSLVLGMFFLFSIQLIFIGLLGEYVTSIHAQVRRGPLVTERERINID
jgi:polyisoprenyl-phosphate glycosyltransferase